MDCYDSDWNTRLHKSTDAAWIVGRPEGHQTHRRGHRTPNTLTISVMGLPAKGVNHQQIFFNEIGFYADECGIGSQLYFEVAVVTGDAPENVKPVSGGGEVKGIEVSQRAMRNNPRYFSLAPNLRYFPYLS
eukprot:GHVN01023642.1.p1 GENE.GHVN01023642.1~~GHVN01023642.1.p1  ORF type:complete len:131 (-),score=13.75 GHVN01023642.1:667-1059(-)